jgi:hypothetical protein
MVDEVFGEKNFCGQVSFRTTGGQSNSLLASSFDLLLWYARDKGSITVNTDLSMQKSHLEPKGQVNIYSWRTLKALCLRFR